MMNYFGTDGIRGIPNVKLTIELMVKLGQALAIFQNKHVCIATDTRRSKDMLASGIAGGAMSRGLHVIYLGVLPTPALIDYARTHEMTGVMITASHNPYQDNGIKILNRGKKLTLEEESLLEFEIGQTREALSELGAMCTADGGYAYYQRISSLFRPTHFKVALDCANGAAYELAPRILKNMVSELVVVAAEPNGININENCGSTHLELLKKTVVEQHCDIGFALDGDGDRVLCVQSDGTEVTGDELIYIIACYLKRNHILNQNKVILSKMSNIGIILALERQGIEVVQTEVGDRYIVAALSEHGAAIGGENSGHIILPQLFSSGDGILTAGFLLQLLEETKTTCKDWLADIHLYPEQTCNIKAHHREDLITNNKLKNQVLELKKKLAPHGKVIVRASGTEECIRVTVMAQSLEQVHQGIMNLTQTIQEMDYE